FLGRFFLPIRPRCEQDFHEKFEVRSSNEEVRIGFSSSFFVRSSNFELHSVPVFSPPRVSPMLRLMSALSSLPGLKYGIFFDGTSTFSPVFGLRPVRDLRLRKRKLPKPRSSIFCPERSESTIESKTMFTIVSACFLVSCTTRATSSTSFAFVITPALASVP